MNPVLAMARHEIRLVCKEPRFLAPFLLTPLLLLGLHGLLALAWAVSPEDLREAVRTFLVLFTLLMPGLAVPLSADSFAGERERRTLDTLLALPVSLKALFWGKILGLYPIPVGIGWLGQAAFLGLLAATGNTEAIDRHTAAMALCLMPVMALFLGSLSVWISLGAESVRGAAQVASLLMVLIFFGVMGASPRLLSSWGTFAGFVAALLALSLAFLHGGRRRFLSR